LSIKIEQLRVLVERVDSILVTRRGLLPAVQGEVDDDAAHRKGDVEHLLPFLAELKQTETDQAALQRIEGAIDDLNRLLATFGSREPERVVTWNMQRPRPAAAKSEHEPEPPPVATPPVIDTPPESPSDASGAGTLDEPWATPLPGSTN